MDKLLECGIALQIGEIGLATELLQNRPRSVMQDRQRIAALPQRLVGQHRAAHDLAVVR